MFYPYSCQHPVPILVITRMSIHVRFAFSFFLLPYYRKLTLHEIKVLEINATSNNANLMENEFRINKINAKGEVEFHNKGN